jgi:lipopolysaccharide export LptBFGC system permease protein LptF
MNANRYLATFLFAAAAVIFQIIGIWLGVIADKDVMFLTWMLLLSDIILVGVGVLLTKIYNRTTF